MLQSSNHALIKISFLRIKSRCNNVLLVVEADFFQMRLQMNDCCSTFVISSIVYNVHSPASHCYHNATESDIDSVNVWKAITEK